MLFFYLCVKIEFVRNCYSDRGAPLYSGTPTPSSGLVKANFFVYYDFYNRLVSYFHSKRK